MPGRPAWLSETLRDGAPVLLSHGVDAGRLAPAGVRAVTTDATQSGDMASRRYDLSPGAAVLLRPDGHVAARFRRPDQARLAAALAKLEGRTA